VSGTVQRQILQVAANFRTLERHWLVVGRQERYNYNYKVSVDKKKFVKIQILLLTFMVWSEN
jgi:hypothetical protein